MPRFVAGSTLILGVCLVIATGFAQQPEVVSGEILVKFTERPPMPDAANLGIPALDRINAAFSVREITPLFAAPNHRLHKSGTSPRTWVKVRFDPSADLGAMLHAYESDPNVQYAQPNYVHRIDFVPNDTLFAEQWALELIRAPEAWDIQRGKPSVIVGVIDTGIDYRHDDLQGALWIHPGEDLNGNGRVDASDFNGVDDDGNGFVDDIRGWDFTDAPTFPDAGDFRDPDNDPFDENGHGTAVAGIIGADGDNLTGIAGLAFGCKIMNLRAGTSLGFLEEDDVASAVVYAVDNGARIINMSFGDDVASPLLRDVMQYAYNNDCVLVASAGNSATDAIHFPSGFSQTISVGATTDRDRLAGFSNFGSSVDVVAPGAGILTTRRGDRYDTFGGTSASAPLVSGLAALILSRTPELSNESVKGLIVSSTVDLGERGWDNRFAAGRIDATRALESPYFSMARITEPDVDDGFADGPIRVRGTASGTFLEAYVLELGVGETPETWVEVFREANRQIIDQAIAEIEAAGLIDTLYTLKLRVVNKTGVGVEDKVRFFVDRTAPVIANVRQTPMLDADRPAVLIEFETDDLCDAALFFRRRGSAEPFEEQELRFRTTTHRVLLTQEALAGEMEYFVQVENGSGLLSTDDNSGAYYLADLSGLPVGGGAFEALSQGWPAGHLLNKISDFDGDGRPEVVFNQYGPRGDFGPLKILEYAGGDFVEVFSTQGILIPRDWGDSDGDGRLELLAGAGPASFIFEAPTVNDFPTELVWVDTNDVWASRFADLDQDGAGEIVLRVGRLFQVWERTGDNTYTMVDSFPNPTADQNLVGVPHTEVGDFDDDGFLEILMGDFDGDVYMYENRGDDRYSFAWSDRLPLIDTIDFLTQGDYNGDGVPEFVVGCHSDPSLNTESTFDSRHWLYRIYERGPDGGFDVVWEQAFFGFQSPRAFDAGVTSGDVDNDGSPEVLINAFPDFYIMDYNPAREAYEVVWHASPNRSNSAVVADFDRDGANAFYFNTGDRVEGYRFRTDFTGPRTPLALRARPLDANVVELTWQAAGVVEGYRVYRGTDPDSLQPLHTVASPGFLDSSVVENVEYWYAVTALDASRTPSESLPSPAVSAIPGPGPFVVRAMFVRPNHVQVRFSERMGGSVKDQTNYAITGIGSPSSAILHRSGEEVILSIGAPLEPGEYTVMVRDVADRQGTPIDTARNAATFEVTPVASAPYLERATLAAPDRLELTFSEPLDPASASRPENYRIEPEVTVDEARLSSEDATLVILQLASDSRIGPFGVDFFVTVSGVKSARGVAIKPGQGDTASLIFSSPDLSDVFAYPNPYRSDSGQDFVTIAGLTREARVRILDASGRLIRTLQETDGNGGVPWDLKDASGKPVASGIYLFYVVGGGDKAVGKLAVMR